MNSSESSQEIAAIISRPILVSVISLLVLVAALFALVLGSVTYTNRDFFLSVLRSQTEAADLGPVTANDLSNLAFILIGYGIIHLAIAYGLWTGKNWGRIASLILSLFGLVLLIPALPFLPEVAVPVVVFALFILYYFTRPHVREFFRS